MSLHECLVSMPCSRKVLFLMNPKDWAPLPPRLLGSNQGPLGQPSNPRLSQPMARASQPIPRTSQPRLSQPIRSNPLSPTAALRARRQVESAQQATSELSVLTEQLIELPDRLRQAGLAGEKSRQLQEAMEAFTELAALAWSGMAEGQLNEIAAQPLYRQRAVAATRRVSRLQQDTANSRPIDEPDLERPTQTALAGSSKRPGPLWRFRTRLYLEALTQWRAAMPAERDSPPAPVALGTALEEVRAAVGFAGMRTTQILLVRLLTWLAVVLGGLVAAIAIGVATSTLTLGLFGVASTLTVVALLLTAIWGYLLGLLMVGRVSIRFVIGAVRWRLIELERHTSLGLLMGWNGVVAVLGTLAALGTLGSAGWLVHFAFLPGGVLHTITDLQSTVRQASGQPLQLVVGAVGILLALPVVLALPSLLIYQGMLARELAYRGPRTPPVRRVALGTALPLLAFHTLLALTAVLVVVHAVPPLTHPFFALQFFQISYVAPLMALTILVLFMVAIAVPYRNGVRHWRGARLGTVQAQKNELAAKLDQLGAEPNLAEEVTAVQYDVARLQFLRLQEEDLSKIPGTAFGRWEQIAALLLVLLTAILADSGLAWVARLFVWR